MKHILYTFALAMVMSTPALAQSTQVQDHYKNVINKSPYNVEVCYDRTVSGDKTGDAVKGAIIGGMLGHSNSTATGGTQRRCVMETRYKETSARVYSHSTITFSYEGRTHRVNFQK